MKFIGYLNAVAAWRETLEEYAPETGATQADMIAVVQGAYSFQVFPPAAMLREGGQPMAFSGGKFPSEPSFAIGALIMEPNGDVVQTVTTDQADRVLEDLATRLDKELGFRLSAAPKRKSYVSNLVVEFEAAFESKIDVIQRVAEIVRPAFSANAEFALKTLSFGPPNLNPSISQVDHVEATDFLIERRAGAAYSQNRYYCSAPMQTAEHLALLERVEAVVLGRAA